MTSLEGLSSAALAEISSIVLKAHSISLLLTSSSSKALLRTSLTFTPYFLAFSSSCLLTLVRKHKLFCSR